MSLMRVFPCPVCHGRGETSCPACHGMGLLKAASGARNEWDVCRRCAGRGVAGCPACLDTAGGPRRFPFCGEPRAQKRLH